MNYYVAITEPTTKPPIVGKPQLPPGTPTEDEGEE